MPKWDTKNLQPNVAQEQVFKKFSSESGATIRQLTPQDRLVDMYPLNDRTPENLAFILIEKNDSQAFDLIFGIALTATTPNQLSNSFGILYALDLYEIHNRNKTGQITQAKIDFLQSRPPFKQHVSDEARVLKTVLIDKWFSEDGEKNPERTGEFISKVWFNYLGTYYEQNKSSLIESTLAIILDPETPIGLRMALLNNAGTSRYGRGQVDSRFDTNASCWRTMSLDWMYPNAKPEDDPRDQYFADMRQELDRLKQLSSQYSVPSSENRGQISELQQQVKSLTEQLRQVSRVAETITERAARRIQVYQKLGCHPLEIFQIPYNKWKEASPKEREELVRKEFRSRVRSLHPDQNKDTDPVVVELRRAQWNRINLAQEFLNDNITDQEF
jgi:hypothetical protein